MIVVNSNTNESLGFIFNSSSTNGLIIELKITEYIKTVIVNID